MLSHHKLKVYEKALALGAGAQEFSVCWGRRHAIVEHFRRASESIVINIAQAASLHGGRNQANTLDYALGSTLECAACLDIASIKGRLSPERSLDQKGRYLEILRMLIGLRKTWLQSVMSEEPGSYRGEPTKAAVEYSFHHESLDVDQVALGFIRWFVCLPGAQELSDRLCKEIDKSATSVVLNIAEGNGRYSALDHGRFLEVAAASAIKTSAYLDLYRLNSLSAGVDTIQGINLLSRVLAMLNKF